MGNIGIIGRARVGKDTAGKWLVDQRGYRRVAFADALKLAAWKIDPIIRVSGFDVPRRWSDSIAGERNYERAKDEVPEVRRFLQSFGATIRELDPDFWLRIALKRVQEANDAGVPVVVTDVRYPNEADSLKRAGFHLIHIARADVPQLDHESEGALGPEDAHFMVHNDNGIPELHEQLEVIWEDIAAIESARHLNRL